MSTGFDCGQYEQAFNSRRLQNYECRNYRKRRPDAKEGFTTIISNNRGHLLPSIQRSMKSPWGTYVGTWDMPLKVPGNKMTDPMARTIYQHHVNCEKKSDADVVIYGKNKRRRPKAGQPVQAMATHMCSSNEILQPRSGAANNQMRSAEPMQRQPTPEFNGRLASAQKASPVMQADVHPELMKTPKPVSPLPCEDPKTGITPVRTPPRRTPPMSRNLTPIRPGSCAKSVLQQKCFTPVV